MLVQQRAKIHPVKLIAAENEVVIVRAVRGSSACSGARRRPCLDTIASLPGLLRGEDLDEAAREIVELVARLDMAMQRHAVELRQHVNRTQTRVEAVADRDIDEAIFSAERHRRLRAIFCQRKKPRARAATHDDGKRALCRAGRKRWDLHQKTDLLRMIRAAMTVRCHDI